MKRHLPSLSSVGALENTGRSGWLCVGASVRGTGHEKSGTTCQDAHAWRRVGADILAACVADGAGSAPLSEIGAQAAATAALRRLSENIEDSMPNTDDAWRSALVSAAEAAVCAVEAAAKARDAEPRELASTLIIAVATPEAVAALQIGDGAVVVKAVEGELYAITTPQHGEYLNETTFLTSANAIDTSQLLVWRGAPRCVAMFSDGLQGIALSTRPDKPHAPFFEPLFRFVSQLEDEARGERELEAFLKSPRLEQRTDDDLTLVLANLRRE